MVDLWRDFWIRETGTGQQVAQLHERYMMMMICAVILWNLTTSRNFILHCHLFGYIIVNLSFKCELNIFSLNLPSKIFVHLMVQKIHYIRNTRIVGCFLMTHSCVKCRHLQQMHTLFSCLKPANSSWWLLKHVPSYYTWAQISCAKNYFK